VGTFGLDGGGGTAMRGEIHFLICHFGCQDGEDQESPKTIKNKERGRIGGLGGDKERKKERGWWIISVISWNAQTFFIHDGPAWTRFVQADVYMDK